MSCKTETKHSFHEHRSNHSHNHGSCNHQHHIHEHDKPHHKSEAGTLCGCPHEESSYSNIIRIRLGIAGLCAAIAEGIHWIQGSDGLLITFALLAIILGGIDIYRQGLKEIIKVNLNINALVCIAVTGAIILNYWSEASMVMVLFNLAEHLEHYSLDKARNAIQSLLQLTPNTTSVLQADGSWMDIPTNNVQQGDTVRVRAGERISLDGVISKGKATLDQSAITGESIPVEKALGDHVFAGTMALSNSDYFEFKVSNTTSNTTIAKIIDAVQKAQNNKSPSERLIDRFAKIYTPIVIAISIFLAISLPFLAHTSWTESIYKALTLLIIACPCALVLSTPISIMSALSVAARQGILVKGGIYIEKVAKLRFLALDKTGTLTLGKPVLETIISCASRSKEDCIQLAASLASQSNHPLSLAISQATNANPLEIPQLETIPGQGVQANLKGKTYFLGRNKVADQSILADWKTKIQTQEKDGKTVVILYEDGLPQALFVLSDPIKGSSQSAIQDLRRLHIHTTLLTGDNAGAAQCVARLVNIDEVHSQQLPQQKQKHIARMAQQGVVGMVGDGINDAPALAQADISFAMGALGSDIAIETADIALMDDDLGKIPMLIHISKFCRRIMVENLCVALGIKLSFLLLTVIGLGTMWMAVFADVGASLLVILNSLRILYAHIHRSHSTH